MHPSSLTPLLENTGLVFRGEAAWGPALLMEREAQKFIRAANACGRPNTDVLRRRLAVVNGEPVEGWQIDFPAHFTTQEAALYEQPFVLLKKRSGDVWLNPHTDSALRRALARVSRWLAMPVSAAAPDWRWIEDDLLPDATLLVVARDDDFTQGVLQSAPFAAWWHAHQESMAPGRIVESFPFPWPPATALSALTAAQEEQRHAIARAARSVNIERLNAAVLAAYGWQLDDGADAFVERLMALNRKRRG